MSYIPSLTLSSDIFATPALSILLPAAAGGAIGYFVAPKRTNDTYYALKQPPYRPAASLFPPVWMSLYGLMGYAAHRAWTTGMSSTNAEVVEYARIGATLYTIQLGLNLAWMPLFYGKGKPILAFIDITALTGTVAYLTYVWGKVDDVAYKCMLPYLGWLGYATYLCGATGYLNNWSFQDKEKRMATKGEETKYVDEEPEGGSLGI